MGTCRVGSVSSCCCRGSTPRRRSSASGTGQTRFDAGHAQETCRDLPHTGFGIASIADFAETTRIQGQSLYPEVQARLRYALGFHARWELGETLPSWLCGGTVHRGLGPTTEVGYNTSTPASASRCPTPSG